MGFFNLFKKTQVNTNVTNVPKTNNEKYHDSSIQTQVYLKNGELGFYRNELFNMSEILRKENKYNDQLKLLCTIFYIDTFGFSSVSAWNVAKEGNFKFIKPNPVVAPRVANNIRICAGRLKMSDSDLEQYFINNLSETMVPSPMLSPKEAYHLWNLYVRTDDMSHKEATAYLNKKIKLFIGRM